MESHPAYLNNLNQIYNKIKSNIYDTPPEFPDIPFTQQIKISPQNRNNLEKLSKLAKFTLISPLELLYKQQYEKNKNISNDIDKCSLCQCEFYDDVIDYNNKELNLKELNEYLSHEYDTIKLFKCNQDFFHIECFSNYIKDQKGFKCTNCQIIYGIIYGNMPKGKMRVKVDEKLHCAGFPKDGTIIIHYNFDNGPGYSGTKRMCFLPNIQRGREILGLLKIAFDRKLTFTVGTSITTGKKNTVVWNGIHHKTNVKGGPTNYGYPDDTYFDRVEQELAAKGVYKCDNVEDIALKLMYAYD